MKWKVVNVLAAVFFFLSAFGQNQEKYSVLVREAERLYEDKQFAASAKKYQEAFQVMDGMAITTDRYNAACANALAKNYDTAFYHLFRLANGAAYDNLDHLLTDTDLAGLHNDKRWAELISIVKANKEKAEANLDKPLVAILDTIYHDDQNLRLQIDSVGNKYGWESKEIKSLFQQMNDLDSVNVIRVSKIIDQRGWLGADIVGRKGNQTLFLVIQHAPLAVQLKYFPTIKEAAKSGKANPADVAMLEDRINVRQHRKQIYGSQLGRDNVTGEFYVFPLEDPDHVDERRAQVGLGTMQNYLSFWKLKWDPEEYKKRLPEYEERLKKISW